MRQHSSEEWKKSGIMPDRDVKTIRDLIYYQYAKIIAKRAFSAKDWKAAKAQPRSQSLVYIVVLYVEKSERKPDEIGAEMQAFAIMPGRLQGETTCDIVSSS